MNKHSKATLLFALVPLVACSTADEEPSSEPEGMPPFATMAGDTARSFVEFADDGSPAVIGVTFGPEFLEGLPQELDPTNRCFDLDGDGTTAQPGECLGEWQADMGLPQELMASEHNVLQWIGFGWNPMGHPPIGIWDKPHFDVHFYLSSREEVASIRTGSCGYDPQLGGNGLLINCEDSVRAAMDVPEQFMPPGYINVGVAVPDMGNHLIMPASPEFAGAEFDHTFIYGSYDGNITFLEPMLTRAYLLSQPDECEAINQPAAWERTGYYPTQYCTRYVADEDRYEITLEGFELHEATMSNDV